MKSRGNCVLLPTSLTSTKLRSETTGRLRLMVSVHRAFHHHGVTGLADDVRHRLDVAGAARRDTDQPVDMLPVFLDQLPAIGAGHRVRHHDRRLAERGDHLAEPVDHHVAGDAVERDVAAAADARPVRHHHRVARACEHVRPSRPAVGCGQIAGAGVGAAADHHHRRLGRAAGGLKDVEVGRRSLDEALRDDHRACFRRCRRRATGCDQRGGCGKAEVSSRDDRLIHGILL